jgi:hypothetical protein
LTGCPHFENCFLSTFSLIFFECFYSYFFVNLFQHLQSHFNIAVFTGFTVLCKRSTYSILKVCKNYLSWIRLHKSSNNVLMWKWVTICMFDFRTDSDVWKEFVSKPCLSYALRILTGLSIKHSKTIVSRRTK